METIGQRGTNYESFVKNEKLDKYQNHDRRIVMNNFIEKYQISLFV